MNFGGSSDANKLSMLSQPCHVIGHLMPPVSPPSFVWPPLVFTPPPVSSFPVPSCDKPSRVIAPVGGESPAQWQQCSNDNNDMYILLSATVVASAAAASA